MYFNIQILTPKLLSYAKKRSDDSSCTYFYELTVIGTNNFIINNTSTFFIYMNIIFETFFLKILKQN